MNANFNMYFRGYELLKEAANAGNTKAQELLGFGYLVRHLSI